MNTIRSLFSKLFTRIASVFLSILTAMGLVSGTILPSGNSITFKDPDNLRLSIALMSDVHIKSDTVSVEQFARGLEDIKNAHKAFDILALTGDITDVGDDYCFNLAWNTVDAAGLSATVLPVIGNHDIKTSYETALNQVSSAASRYTSQNITKSYYSYTKNGYKFIVMGTESEANAYISPEQLSFLDSELLDGTKEGKPVFVICHFPLANTHGLPDPLHANGDIGAQSEEIKNILTKYKNVFYINGHLHVGIASTSLDVLSEENGVYSINLPSYGQPNLRGNYKGSGNGTYVEVYDNEVIFIARSLKESYNLRGYEKSFSLK